MAEQETDGLCSLNFRSWPAVVFPPGALGSHPEKSVKRDSFSAFAVVQTSLKQTFNV
jgi:hypothetical protein